MYIVSMFQFHKGSINTIHAPSAEEVPESFNSIKVRLIQRKINQEHVVSQFQFHKGSINTWQRSEAHTQAHVSIP